MADIDRPHQIDRSDPHLSRMVWDSALVDLNPATQHALVFSMADRCYAIGAEFIEQIVELPRFTETPNVNPCLLGLTQHAGQPIPVLDISPLLNCRSEGFRHGLLLNHNGLRVMLAIEAVVVLRDLANHARLEVPAEYLATGFVEYVCELSNDNAASIKDSDRRQVVVLEVPRLLAAIENGPVARAES